MNNRFFLWMFLGALTGIGLLFTCLTLSFGSQPEGGRWTNECLQKKTEAVKKIQPKMIILSGSNSLFGFSARKFSDEYKVPTVNAAVQAGLGLDYILGYARSFIAPGRIFILPLEYELYGKADEGADYIYQVVGFDPEYFFRMPILSKLKIASGISWRTYAHLLKKSQRNETGGRQPITLNAWGDETVNTIENRTHAVVVKANNRSKKKYSIDANAWDKLNNHRLKAGGFV